MSIRKTAIVTGGSSGIGIASAIRFAQKGYNVVITGRRQEKLDEAKSKIEAEANGGHVLTVQADMGEESDVRKCYNQVDEKFGRLDVIVANAGVNGTWASIEQMEVDDFDSTIKTNLRGTWLTIKFGLPLMKGKGIKGSIIVVASINGTRTFANTGATAYASSKAGQIAITKMLALELANHQIRVNAVCPGAIDTSIEENTTKVELDHIRIRAEFPDGVVPLTPDHKSGKSEQVADVIYFLASDQASHVTGTEMFVDGGESLIAI
ncbi:hypothetical protein AKO1_007825 [Acrasis kona]|uniref:Uncharacterized protein n=1 Tax=Acrasis kona TaxID=1008807 RepID=A0AAW2YP96_9EUKA